MAEEADVERARVGDGAVTRISKHKGSNHHPAVPSITQETAPLAIHERSVRNPTTPPSAPTTTSMVLRNGPSAPYRPPLSTHSRVQNAHEHTKAGVTTPQTMMGAMPLSLFVIFKIRVMTAGKMKAVGRARMRDQFGGVVEVCTIAIGSGTTTVSPDAVVLIPRSRGVAGAEAGGGVA